MSVEGRHSSFPEASGELTDDEIHLLYSKVVPEAEAFFVMDPSYLIDIARSGAQAATRREKRSRVA